MIMELPGFSVFRQTGAALLLAILLIAAASPSDAQVLINEVQSSNSSTLADEDGDYEDWIELYNTGDEPFDISHFGLSDDFDRPFRWTFPEGTVIGAGEFLLVWASGKDRNDPERELHTNFSIAQAGEEVLLTHFQTGERLDEIDPIEIPSDQSYGRDPDGSDNWVFFRNPTPGESNTDGDHALIPEAVTFSKKGGFYQDSIDIALSAEEGYEIRYTLDGSVPTAASQRYRDPIRITDRSDEPNDLSTIIEISNNYGNAAPPIEKVFKGTVVRAAAFGRGVRSDVVTQTYFVDERGDDRYSVPVISLSSHADSLFGYDRGIYVLGRRWDEDGQRHGLGADANFAGRGHDWERPMHMEMYETDGSQVVSQDIGVRIHGGASRHFPQKSFRLYSRSDYGTSRFRYRFFPEMDLDNFNRLILRHSGQDVTMTMFRDAYIQETVKHMNFPTQAARAVKVFINGEYWGLYNIRERFDIHFLETHYDVDREEVDLMTGNAVLKDGSRDHYDGLVSYFEQHGARDDEHLEHIQTMMDTENFRDYYIAQIYARNTDWPHNNIDYWRYQSDYNPDADIPEQDGRWRWMMFDMDFGFGWQSENFPFVPNDWDGPRLLDRRAHTRNMFDHVFDDNWSTMMFRELMQNRSFREDFYLRFADMLNTTFRPERMEAVLDSMKAIYEPEIKEHIIRWNKNEPEVWDHFYRPVISKQEWVDEVNVMREFVEKRQEYQWDHLLDRTGYRTSDLTVDVSDPALGHVRVNSIDITGSTEGVEADPWPWTGTYPRELTSTLSAKPAEDAVFERWLQVVEDDTIVYSTEENVKLKPGEDIHLLAEFRRLTVVSEEAKEIPDQFRIKQNYPNPFNNQTVIPYQLPENAAVTLDIYSADGRLVRSIREGTQQPGEHSIRVDASGMASGVYIARLNMEPQSGGNPVRESIKMVIVR